MLLAPVTGNPDSREWGRLVILVGKAEIMYFVKTSARIGAMAKMYLIHFENSIQILLILYTAQPRDRRNYRFTSVSSRMSN